MPPPRPAHGTGTARHRIRGVGYADHAARRGVGTKRKVASLVEGNMPAPALAPCAQHGRGAGADAVPEMPPTVAFSDATASRLTPLPYPHKFHSHSILLLLLLQRNKSRFSFP